MSAATVQQFAGEGCSFDCNLPLNAKHTRKHDTCTPLEVGIADREKPEVSREGYCYELGALPAILSAQVAGGISDAECTVGKSCVASLSVGRGPETRFCRLYTTRKQVQKLARKEIIQAPSMHLAKANEHALQKSARPAAVLHVA